MKNYTLIVFLLILITTTGLKAQEVAIRTNLLYWGTTPQPFGRNSVRKENYARNYRRIQPIQLQRQQKTPPLAGTARTAPVDL